ncbi:hypothetical protein [Cryobacterium cryoconiti]|uniref:hypothetical protein n=1 Tax=Cryobacterium cryoconiti TaxID=1259239 RepID=UPI001F53F83B|nr:hypothetical protein [Cryobacterium cryoconiti]
MSRIAPDQAPAYTAEPLPAASSPLAVSSLVLGLVSILAGWTFLVPIAGLVAGILALGREPQARTLAIWGIVLNAVLLAGSLLLVLLALALGLLALPFAFLI